MVVLPDSIYQICMAIDISFLIYSKNTYKTDYNNGIQ